MTVYTQRNSSSLVRSIVVRSNIATATPSIVPLKRFSQAAQCSNRGHSGALLPRGLDLALLKCQPERRGNLAELLPVALHDLPLSGTSPDESLRALSDRVPDCPIPEDVSFSGLASPIRAFRGSKIF